MTELKLYNTLTRRKEVFRPIDPSNVRMYVCGPTVYDFAHIGNARPAIVFDVLFRLLRHVYGDDHVTYVRNITDVDDKINARALRDYGDRIRGGELSLNDAIRQVTETTAKQYHEDVAALGCLKPTVEPRATEHIDGMVAMIQQLLDRGNAYLASGNEGREVLFDVASMPDYGALSRRRLEDQQAGARVAVEDHKKNPADFVLWKESSPDEPGWEGKFTAGGNTVSIHGRPGWHIECSVMSGQLLGETFDIHGGGLDLIFPHHENEIAQSRCAHDGAVMANVWMHNGFVQVEGRKMAKSEGNFVTIHDLLHTEKFGQFAWPGQVLRYAMLMTHYREPIDFSVSRLEEASTELSKFKLAVSGEEPGTMPSAFINALADDLNTPAAIAVMRNLAGAKPVYAAEVSDSREFVDATSQLEFDTERRAQLAACLDLLGIDIKSYDQNWVTASVGEDRARVITSICDRRLALLAEKNFAEADAIRDELAAQGIQLMDYKDPETGERRTKWEVKR